MALVSLVALLPKRDYAITCCINNKNDSAEPHAPLLRVGGLTPGFGAAAFYLSCRLTSAPADSIRRKADATVEFLCNRSYRENEVGIRRTEDPQNRVTAFSLAHRSSNRGVISSVPLQRAQRDSVSSKGLFRGVYPGVTIFSYCY